MDFLGYRTTIDAGKMGGFIVHVTDFNDIGLAYQDRRGIHKELQDQLSDITHKLRNTKSRVSSLREKLDKFEKDAIHTAFDRATYKGRDFNTPRVRKTLEQFKDYYDKDDASSTGTSQGSSVDDLTNQMGRIDLSPAGASVEDQRQLAMKRPFIEEKVADFSDVFHEGKDAPKKGYEGLEATGMKEHLVFGEKHYKAKLTGAEATQIRTRYFAGERPVDLHKEYKVALTTVNQIVSRNTWKHLPQVPGEPDEYLARPNQQEQTVLKIAKQYGVEPVRNKIGRLALPPELIKRLRKEKAEKKKETKE
jgi:hypothetical protein